MAGVALVDPDAAGWHPCPGCGFPCRADYLACPEHWRMVSRLTQRKLEDAVRRWAHAEVRAISEAAVAQIRAGVENRRKQLAAGRAS